MAWLLVQEIHLDKDLSAYYHASFGEFMERKQEEAEHDIHPSATSSFSAGAVFWGMVWATLGKLNELVHFVGFKKSNPCQTVLRWINAHKVVIITLTEAVNYSVHGISSPLGVVFALGGTLDEKGNSTLDLEGFAGHGCEKAFEDFRGGDMVKVERKKPAYYTGHVNQQGKSQR